MPRTGKKVIHIHGVMGKFKRPLSWMTRRRRNNTIDETDDSIREMTVVQIWCKEGLKRITLGKIINYINRRNSPNTTTNKEDKIYTKKDTNKYKDRIKHTQHH